MKLLNILFIASTLTFGSCAMTGKKCDTKQCSMSKKQCKMKKKKQC